MNQKLWNEAIEFHGHQCMGLALGFRMGEEAKKIFGQTAEIHCRIPARNCITDGITVTTGASVENGRVVIDSSLSGYEFYLPEEEEGWCFTYKQLDFPKTEDSIKIVLTGARDFLFQVMPFDLEA